MTTLVFRTRAGRVTGVTVTGHAMPEDAEGPDLPCCAVTSMVRLTECVINDVCGAGAAAEVREEPPRIVLTLPEHLPEGVEDTCQALLTGLMACAAELHNEYPDAVEALETEDGPVEGFH